MRRYGRTKLIPLTSIEPLHEVESWSRVERIARHMRARGGWGGRPVLVERALPQTRDDNPERRYMAWTGSHRLPAAFAESVWLVPAIEVDLDKWVATHGPRLPAVDETYDDETRLAMLTAAGDWPAVRLMEKECPANYWELETARPPKPDPGFPWTSLGPHIKVRKVGRIVEVRTADGSIEEFSPTLLRKLAAFADGRGRTKRAR